MRLISVFGFCLLLILPQAAAGQATGTITGRIIGTGGQPVSGATVGVGGTQRGDQSGADGRFTITAVPVGSRTVRATFAGYQEATRSVTVAAGQTVTVDITLVAQVVQLEGVVAIGYGTARRRDLTGSIASVSGEDAITRAAPTAAVANALQGKAPGVQVVSNSGAPGAGVSVRVRGSNSIDANSEPLYVIDGLPVTQGAAGTGNPLSAIDPSDIESMEILKDAASTSIYGARGANGVILITTKRGQRGVSAVEFETSYGIQTITSDIEVLNGPEFMQFINETRVNSNQTVRYSPQDIANARTFDYMEAITRDAPQMNHSVSVSGGDAETRFLVGANYSQQKGIIVGTEFNRYGLRLNLDRNVSSRFRVGNSLSLTHVLEKDPGGGAAYTTAMQYIPFVFPKDSAGNVINRDLGSFGVPGVNPVVTVENVVNNLAQWRGIGNLFAEYDLADGLRLRSNFGGNIGFERTSVFNPSVTSQGFALGGTANVANSQSIALTNENLVTWNVEGVGPGNLDLLGGFSIQRNETQNQLASGATLPSDALEYYNLGVTTTNRAVGSGFVESALLSFLGRANYNLLDRYLFTVTARRDGSSRFGAANKWAFFPSAAFAWRAIDEGFMQNQTFFSDLKFRLSYGRTGNQAINEFQSLPQLVTQFYALGTVPVERVAIAPSAQAGNPDLKWETTSQTNVGLDIGFFSDRLTATIDAYQSRTSDLLLTVDQPFGTGFATQLRNVGSIQNRGVEVALSSVNFEGDRFSWRSSFNVSHNTNEVLELFGEQKEILPADNVQGLTGGTNVIRVGESLGAIYGIETDGLYQQGDACNLNRVASCAPGEIKAIDRDGDRDVDLNDRTIIGYGDPKFFGGFNNSLAYGPVSLDAFFNYSYGNSLANLPLVYSMMGRGIVNERKEMLDRWTPTNTNTTIPRANNLRDTFLYDILVEDASFIRLQTLTLGYRLPQDFVPGVNSARLFLTGQNVWLSSDYRGFDPEANARGGSSSRRGIDFNTYPRARTWNFGANVTL